MPQCFSSNNLFPEELSLVIVQLERWFWQYKSNNHPSFLYFLPLCLSFFFLSPSLLALVEEIYKAQRERDQAVMARLRLANEERDEALLRAKKLQEAALEYVLILH